MPGAYLWFRVASLASSARRLSILAWMLGRKWPAYLAWRERRWKEATGGGCGVAAKGGGGGIGGGRKGGGGEEEVRVMGKGVAAVTATG